MPTYRGLAAESNSYQQDVDKQKTLISRQRLISFIFKQLHLKSQNLSPQEQKVLTNFIS